MIPFLNTLGWLTSSLLRCNLSYSISKASGAVRELPGCLSEQGRNRAGFLASLSA